VSIAAGSVTASPFITYSALPEVMPNLADTSHIILTTLLMPYTALAGVLGSIAAGLLLNRRARRKLDTQINSPASPQVGQK
jgi:ABC-type methionine transport system permease subunit